MSIVGSTVNQHNDKIVKCIIELETQRDDLQSIIQKQMEEKEKLHIEIQRVSYKLAMLEKSMAQRIVTKANYDKAITKAHNGYNNLLLTTEKLLNSVCSDVHTIEEVMDKKINTDFEPTIENNNEKAGLEKDTVKQINFCSD